MHVVQASKAYWPHLGGVETVVQQLAEAAASRPGWTSTVVVGSDSWRGRANDVNGVRVVRAGTLASVRSAPLAPSYPWRLLREHGDVLHVHEPSVLPGAVGGLWPGVLRRRFGRLVVSWHSDVVRQRVLAAGYEPLQRRLLTAADRIVVATPNHVTSSSMLGPFADKVAVIPYGIDPTLYEATPAVVRRAAELRAQHGPRLALVLGRLVYYKGVPELVRAADALPDVRFVLIGDGPLRDDALASEAARAGSLQVIPPVAGEEKVAWLHACDVLVLPSTAPSEAFGIVQLEAMVCGKPVVTFDLPTGVTWVNRHRETGLIAPLGATARQRVLDEFTVEQMIRRVFDVYQGGSGA